MKLIETHAHIYLPEFKADLEAMVQRADEIGVAEILMPAIDKTTHLRMIETEKHFVHCKAMMGLHPCSVKEKFEDEIDVVKEWLEKRKFIAIGEIGLDFYWDKTHTKQQYEAFHQQIELALHYHLPVVIHSRNATQECIELVKKYPDLGGVFHCFSGTIEQAYQLLSIGFYMGIGGVLTFKNSGLDGVIAEVGLRNVVLETDAPYLAPVPYRGKRNECSYLKLIAEKMATVTGKTVEEVAELTTANAKNLFHLA